MSYPVYEVPAGDTLPVLFDTFDGGTGASITLTGLAVTDIEIYKDGGTTQRASDAGYTLLDTDGIDFDSITGIHGFSIDTSDDTDSGFYTVGSWYHVVVSSVTIDAQTVNFIACAFRIMKAESVAGVPKADVDAWLGTAAATPTVNGVPEVDVTHWIGTAASTPTTAGVPEVDVIAWLGTAAATPTTAGVPEVDVTHIDGDATAAQRLEALLDGVLIAAVNDASATTTAFAADGFTEATDDHFVGRLITFITGDLAGQQTDITSYDASGGAQGEQEFTVTALTEAPAENDLFVVH